MPEARSSQLHATDTIVGSNAVITESSCDRATVGDGATSGPIASCGRGPSRPGRGVSPHRVVEPPAPDCSRIEGGMRAVALVVELIPGDASTWSLSFPPAPAPTLWPTSASSWERPTSRFANGDIHCKYDISIRGCDVFIVQTHSSPVNDSLMEHLIMIDAAKRRRPNGSLRLPLLRLLAPGPQIHRPRAHHGQAGGRHLSSRRSRPRDQRRPAFGADTRLL